MSEYTLAQKVTSGRRFLVYIAGLSFLMFTVTVCYCLAKYASNKDVLPVFVALAGQLISLVVFVYKDYKDKKDREENGGNEQ